MTPDDDLQKRADRQVPAHEAAELKRDAISLGELQIRDQFAGLGRQLQCARHIVCGRGPRAARNRRGAARDKPSGARRPLKISRFVVLVKRHQRRHAIGRCAGAPPGIVCFAFDSSSRDFRPDRRYAAAKAPSSKGPLRGDCRLHRRCSHYVDHFYNDMTMRIAHSAKNIAPGRHQLSADEPHPTAVGESVHRLVQSDRAPVAGANFDRDLAAVRRSRSDDSKAQRFNEPACLFYSRAETRRTPGRPRPDVFTSPCDAIVGASGRIHRNLLVQAKGFPYTLQDLLIDPQLVDHYRDGQYVTLRLTSSMYHRFHAPYDCTIDRVSYISGDTWNVNPIALKRVPSCSAKTNAPSFRRCCATRV